MLTEATGHNEIAILSMLKFRISNFPLASIPLGLLDTISVLSSSFGHVSNLPQTYHLVRTHPILVLVTTPPPPTTPSPTGHPDTDPANLPRGDCAGPPCKIAPTAAVDREILFGSTRNALATGDDPQLRLSKIWFCAFAVRRRADWRSGQSSVGPVQKRHTIEVSHSSKTSPACVRRTEQRSVQRKGGR